MKIEEAVKVLVNELNADESYRMSWKANIAMAFKDNWHCYMKNNREKIFSQTQEETIHEIANNSADFFLNLLCRDDSKETDMPGMVALALEVEKAQ